MQSDMLGILLRQHRLVPNAMVVLQRLSYLELLYHCQCATHTFYGLVFTNAPKNARGCCWLHLDGS